MTRLLHLRWLPFLLALGACSAEPVTRAAGCWDLRWFRDGAPQIGPLLPDHVHLTDSAVEDAGAAPGPGEWFQVEKAPGVVDTSTSPFAAAVSWPDTFLERGWHTLPGDSAFLVLAIPEAMRLEIRFGVDPSGEAMQGTGWYRSNGDSSRIAVNATRPSCSGEGGEV